MWAWVNSTASIEFGGTGKGFQLRSRSCLYPWNRPQSTRMRRPADSTRYREPVTVPLAPRKLSEALISNPPNDVRPLARDAGRIATSTSGSSCSPDDGSSSLARYVIYPVIDRRLSDSMALAGANEWAADG